MKLAEVIKCQHGVIFAACSYGHQDKEWYDDAVRYVEGGCTIEIVPTKEADLKHCDCPKTKEQAAKVAQLTFKLTD